MNKMEIYEMRYEDISSLCKNLDKIVDFSFTFFGEWGYLSKERGSNGTTKSRRLSSIEYETVNLDYFQGRFIKRKESSKLNTTNARTFNLLKQYFIISYHVQFKSRIH